MKSDSIAAIALKDIRDSLFSEYKKEDVFTYYATGWGGVRTETWFCFGNYLYTKENRRLNQKLGLWAVNKKNNSKYLKKIN